MPDQHPEEEYEEVDADLEVDPVEYEVDPGEYDPAEYEVDPGEVDLADFIDPEHDDDPTRHMSDADLAEMAWEAQQAQEEYEAALVQEAIHNISTDTARAYLGKYGDAVDARITGCLEQAEALVKVDAPGPALTLATSAIEIAIRFLLLRPLVQGAFLSDRWAGILATRVVSGRTAGDRELLPGILREWGLDVNKVTSESGIQVWPFIKGRMWPLRDRFVHQAEPVAAKIASEAIDCARTFRAQVVGRVATKLGFTLETTGLWSVITKGNQTHNFVTADPFAELAAKGKKK
jgi:hypothetical protein